MSYPPFIPGDIAKCSDQDCPVRERCLRYMGSSGDIANQVYGDHGREKGKDQCEDGFMPIPDNV